MDKFQDARIKDVRKTTKWHFHNGVDDKLNSILVEAEMMRKISRKGC